MNKNKMNKNKMNKNKMNKNWYKELISSIDSYISTNRIQKSFYTYNKN